ncbi:hypothetical protein GCM10010116_38990 [Microbispora rosea subsp. aerata]|nr:hypothetical protein GCM10010116_38990 [Microbispora rosea subsp. aerata]GIH54420.1 hypothetical protein Mro02_13340 [Microbispora rosea subsp. aerata]GLJ81392.1 hypothetical protein GCM10017588_01150 [Microbispora rosea subsp. aerata]
MDNPAPTRFRPDAVLLDVMPPDLDGLEVLRRPRAEAPDVRVLFLTARDAAEDRIAGIPDVARRAGPVLADADERQLAATRTATERVGALGVVALATVPRCCRRRAGHRGRSEGVL